MAQFYSLSYSNEGCRHRTVCCVLRSNRLEKENGDISEDYIVIENTRELYCNRKHENKGDCPWLKIMTGICLWHSRKSR